MTKFLLIATMMAATVAGIDVGPGVGRSVTHAWMQTLGGRCLGPDELSVYEVEDFRAIMTEAGASGDTTRAAGLFPAPPDTTIRIVQDSVSCARTYATLHRELDSMAVRLGIPVVPDSVMLYRIGSSYRAVERRGGDVTTHHVMDTTFRYLGRRLMY